MNIIVSGTPIEKYKIGKRTVHVKREDKCCPPPSFSKLRGVGAHLKTREELTIGVLDTFHSEAGWGTALLCKAMKRKCVVFYPVYKANPGMRVFQKKAQELGAEIIGIDAGRSCILYHYAKQLLADKYPNSYMLPNALKLSETVEETANEVKLTVPPRLLKDCTWINSASSGTISAGVLKGMIQSGARESTILVVHEGYSRPPEALQSYIFSYIEKAPYSLGLSIIDEGYDYKQSVICQCPFPCNPYYDRKAWNWLVKNINNIQTKNVLFWNVGA